MNARNLGLLGAMLAVAPLVSACTATPVALIKADPGVLELRHGTDNAWSVSLGDVNLPLQGATLATPRWLMRTGTGSALLVSSEVADCKDKLTLFAAGSAGLKPAELGCGAEWMLMAPNDGAINVRVGNPAQVWTVQNGDLSGPVTDEPPPVVVEHVHTRRRVRREASRMHARVVSHTVAAPAPTPMATRNISHVTVTQHPAFDPLVASPHA